MIYQRDITLKLILLRAIFFVAFGLCMYSFRTAYSEYGYILAVLLLFGLFIHFSQFRVSNQNIEVVKYYCYGWIPVKWAFHRDDIISVQPYEIELETHSDGAYAADDDGWGCLLFFLPSHKATIYRFIIKYTRADGEEKSLLATLTIKEYNMIKPA
jgi:hypothetical protein